MILLRKHQVRNMCSHQTAIFSEHYYIFTADSALTFILTVIILCKIVLQLNININFII